MGDADRLGRGPAGHGTTPAHRQPDLPLNLTNPTNSVAARSGGYRVTVRSADNLSRREPTLPTWSELMRLYRRYLADGRSANHGEGSVQPRMRVVVTHLDVERESTALGHVDTLFTSPLLPPRRRDAARRQSSRARCAGAVHNSWAGQPSTATFRWTNAGHSQSSTTAMQRGGVVAVEEVPRVETDLNDTAMRNPQVTQDRHDILGETPQACMVPVLTSSQLHS